MPTRKPDRAMTDTWLRRRLNGQSGTVFKVGASIFGIAAALVGAFVVVKISAAETDVRVYNMRADVEVLQSQSRQAQAHIASDEAMDAVMRSDVAEIKADVKALIKVTERHLGQPHPSAWKGRVSP